MQYQNKRNVIVDGMIMFYRWRIRRELLIDICHIAVDSQNEYFLFVHHNCKERRKSKNKLKKKKRLGV